MEWNIRELKLQLRYSWKLSRNSSDEKTNFIVTVSEDDLSASGEAAPNIRYGETPEIISSAFNQFRASAPKEITSLEMLTEVLNGMLLPAALRFAVESAYVHLLVKKSGKTVPQLLGFENPQPAATSFSIPIMDPGLLEAFWNQHNLARFSKIKLKVNSDIGLDIIRTADRISNQQLLIDANESWKDVDELIRFTEKLKPFRVEILEQPMPSSMEAEYLEFKSRSQYPVFADESVTRGVDVSEIAKRFHGLNMKLMKAGGYLEGVRQLKEARKAGLQTMAGCMVETTLGIWSALQLTAGVNYVDLDGFLIVNDEPFDMVKEKEGVLYPAAKI